MDSYYLKKIQKNISPTKAVFDRAVQVKLLTDEISQKNKKFFYAKLPGPYFLKI